MQTQVAWVLSLDHDARGFAALAQADPILGPLFEAAPGLRPPLFYSVYEAAFWQCCRPAGATRQSKLGAGG